MQDNKSTRDLCSRPASPAHPALPVDSDEQWRVPREPGEGAKVVEPSSRAPSGGRGENTHELEQAQGEQYNDCKVTACQADQQQQHQTKDDSKDCAQQVYRSLSLQQQQHHNQQQQREQLRPSQYQALCAYPPAHASISIHQHQQFMPAIIPDRQLHALQHHPGQYVPPPQPIIPNYQVLWTQAAAYHNHHLQYAVPPPPPPGPALSHQPGHHLYAHAPDGFAMPALPPLPVVGQFFPAPNYYTTNHHAHPTMSPAMTYSAGPGQRHAIYTAQPHPVVYPLTEHNMARAHHYQATPVPDPVYNHSSCSTAEQQYQQFSHYNYQPTMGLPVAVAHAAGADERQLDETSIKRNGRAESEENEQQSERAKTSSRSASLMQGHESDKIEMSPNDKVNPSQVNTCGSQASTTTVTLPGASSAGYSNANDYIEPADDDDDGGDEKVAEVEEIAAEEEVEEEEGEVVVVEKEEEEEAGEKKAPASVALEAASEHCASQVCREQEQQQHNNSNNNTNNNDNNDDDDDDDDDDRRNDVISTTTIVRPDKISYQCEQTVGRESGLRSCDVGVCGSRTPTGTDSSGIDCDKVSSGKSQHANNRHKQQLVSASIAMTAVAGAATAAAGQAVASQATAGAAILTEASSSDSGSLQTGPSSAPSLKCESLQICHNSHHKTVQESSLAATSGSDSPILMTNTGDQAARGARTKRCDQESADGAEEGEDEDEQKNKGADRASDTISCRNEGNVSKSVPVEDMPINNSVSAKNVASKPGCNSNNNCYNYKYNHSNKQPTERASGDFLKQETDNSPSEQVSVIASEGERCASASKDDANDDDDRCPAESTSVNSSTPADTCYASQLGATSPQNQRQRQPNQISINGTTFYSVPAAIIHQANLHSYHHHQQQQHYNPHMILSYPYQGTTTSGAHYHQHHHHNQQFALATTTTYPSPAYYYHQNQPTMPVAIGSQPSAHHHLMVSGVPPPQPPHPILVQSGSSASIAGHVELEHTIGCEPMHKIDSQHQHELHHHKSLKPSNVGFSQLKLGYNLIPLLPIDASPTRIRQAYGMDKVWQDEFELLFSKFVSSVVWTLVEVETNPSIRNTNRILNYKGRYIVRAGGPTTNGNTSCSSAGSIGGSSSSSRSSGSGGDNFEKCYQDGSIMDESATDSSVSSVSSGVGDASCSLNDGATNKDDSLLNMAHGGGTGNCGESWTDEVDKEAGQIEDSCDKQEAEACYDSGGSLICDDKADTVDLNGEDKDKPPSRHCESDCDSGAMFNSTSSGASETMSNEFNTSDTSNRNLTPVASPCLEHQQLVVDTHLSSKDVKQQQQRSGSLVAFGETKPVNSLSEKKFPLRFKMFIDSAKVRFCCDNCGHGWTSMKGRVVFWYELFELIDEGDGISNLIGYCAYKLFGQQCDVCKIEHRFERPMWYPEEVTKVLANLYNKIGQVYFGFKMPSIDKQRRAGKPKTSHNSLLCQACHDGVCTDRK